VIDEILFQITEEELDEIDNAIIYAIGRGYGNVLLFECIHKKIIDYRLSV
jgi:hypothetical protein